MKPEVLDYEILTQARALIADPKHWVRGVSWAKSVCPGGAKYPCRKEEAEGFCIYGAIAKVMGDMSSTKVMSSSAFQQLRSAINGGDPVYYNDRHTHEEVLAMVDKALALTMALMK